MSIDHSDAPRPLPDRPNLRHLKDQAKDLLKAGAAASIADAQFKVARLYGFASWPKLGVHIDSFEERLGEIVECTALRYALLFGGPRERRTVTLLRERGAIE
jgi:hypothetical protein